MSLVEGMIASEHRFDGLAVRCYGRRDDEPVLLSPGLGGLGDYWAPHLATLLPRRRIILYDHRGTGRSDRALPGGYRVEHMAGDIRSILDGLGLASAHVVGHAAGGVAALKLAALAPGRIRSLTIINGWAKPDPHFVRCMEIRREILRAQGALAYLKAQPLFLYPAGWISANLARLDRAAAEHARDFQSPEVLFARMDALMACDLTADLESVECPVLLVAAEDDMLVPVACSQALAAGLTSAAVSFDLHPYGGHAVNVTQLGRFEASLIGFLSDPRQLSYRKERA